MERIELGDDDVISMKTVNLSLTKYLMSKFSDIKNAAKGYAGNPLLEWISHGVECEILQTKGGGWIKGRISARITIDFIPDAIEIPLGTDTTICDSGLDDLRKKFNS
jgi:KGK domain